MHLEQEAIANPPPQVMIRESLSVASLGIEDRVALLPHR